MSDNGPMPKGWILAPLGELTRINPRELDKEPGDGEHISFVPMTLVEAGTGRLDSSVSRLWREARKGYTRFQDNDVLFAKITPCMENAKFALAANLISGRGAGSTEFHVIRPTAAILPKFILYFVLQERVRREARLSMRGAAGQLRVPPEFLDRAEIPVAPVPEQERIIEEIEKQFTRLDAAVAALKRVQANLKRYRASVLKAASEGRLVPTEAELARREGRSFEPASVLLERILAERRSGWESAQLAKIKEAKRELEEAKGKKKYREPVAPEPQNLPRLPEGWEWATVDQVTLLVTKGTSPGWQGFDYVSSGVPFIRSQNVRWGQLDLSEIAFVEQRFNTSHSNSIIREGDVLLNLVGASVGRSSIATREIDGANTNQAVGIIRLVQKGIRNKFLMFHLLSPAGQAHIQKTKADVARANFNLDDIRPTPIPIPPFREQIRITDETDRRLSVIHELEAQLEATFLRTERLRQSILKSAFEGNLVPQDPTDEPASVLLERIRVDRNAAHNSATTAPRGRRKKEAAHVS